MPATHRQRLLALTAAAALAAVPMTVHAQAGSGTSVMPQASQTTPQEGALGGTAGGRAGANAGQGTTQTIPGNGSGAAGGRGEASDRRVPPNMQGKGHTSANDQKAGSPMGNSGGNSGQNQAPRNGASGTPSNSNAPDKRSDAGNGGPVLAALDSASMRDARRASRVIGAAVYNEGNESVGEVDDIVLPANGGAPAIAVVSVGGFLGIGAKLVAVPFERLRTAGERNRWILTGAASRDDLNKMPTFSYDGTAGRG